MHEHCRCRRSCRHRAGRRGFGPRFWQRAALPQRQLGWKENTGILSAVLHEQPDLDALAGGLGERFEVLRNTYKAYPCGIVIQPIIDACLKLREDHSSRPGSGLPT